MNVYMISQLITLCYHAVLLQVQELQQLYPLANLPSCSTITLDFASTAQHCSNQSCVQQSPVALSSAAFADLCTQFSSTGQLAAASASLRMNALRSLSHCFYLTPQQVSALQYTTNACSQHHLLLVYEHLLTHVCSSIYELLSVKSQSLQGSTVY
jgi:hypothetical protein